MKKWTIKYHSQAEEIEVEKVEGRNTHYTDSEGYSKLKPTEFVFATEQEALQYARRDLQARIASCNKQAQWWGQHLKKLEEE